MLLSHRLKLDRKERRYLNRGNILQQERNESYTYLLPVLHRDTSVTVPGHLFLNMRSGNVQILN